MIGRFSGVGRFKTFTVVISNPSELLLLTSRVIEWTYTSLKTEIVLVGIGCWRLVKQLFMKSALTDQRHYAAEFFLRS